MRQIHNRIAKLDADFAPWLKGAPLCPIDTPRHESHFETIVYAVIGQQVSTKAADTMTHRLIAATGGKVTAVSVARLGFDGLRELGFTRAKSRTMSEFADKVCSGELDLEHIQDLSDEDITRELSALWGIGRWTVEMFLIFHLGRRDVWPTGDLVVRRGWAIIKGLDQEPAAKEIEHEADHLRPFRSVVAWHCWRATAEEPDFW